MFITNLEIEHFRGVKKSNIKFPLDSRIICMIGAGDSTKSTILKAVEWICYPSWNLMASDNDFFECDTSAPIVLRGTFKELPSKLISEDKYGLYLRKPHVLLTPGEDDEPENLENLCLTIQLTIDKTLEPKWEVVCNRREPCPISYNDRKLLFVTNIGNNCSKDMVWGRYSVLQKYADAKGVLHDAHMEALRKIASEADLSTLDDISNTLVTIGQQYGVEFNDQIKSKLFVQNSSFSSSVGLFDGNRPLNQKGTGSQRLLSMGLNINSSSGDALLLIDEIESGLEPYRLRSIINNFRTTHLSTGQVIMTTHSPIAVAECTIGELLIVQSKLGCTEVMQLKTGDQSIDSTLQAQIRKNAEAFLCKRLIVCEGKTEIGFIRALDAYLERTNKLRIAYKGVGTANGEGSNLFSLAKILLSCGYDVCLLMDSDLPNENQQKEELKKEGIPIFDWEPFNAIEEQIFQDVPTTVANQLLDIVIQDRGLSILQSRLEEEDIPFEVINGKINLCNMTPDSQKKLGKIAKHKSSAWYKRIELGELFGNIIFENWQTINEDTILKKVVNDLKNWVKKDD